MYIEFLGLSIRNFLSYGNNTTIFPLSKLGTTLIVGEDLDYTSEGTGGNGVGKTTLINALTYAVYDKPVSDISKDKLVNNINNKNMEVTVDFKIGDTLYKIKRERKSKAGAAGNNVYFWINGEDKTLDSVANTNTMIEDIIGIKYDLFVRIVVFSATLEPFLDLPKAEQAGMFERLVGLTVLSDKASSLKELIKESENIIKLKKTRIELIEQEHKRHNIQLTNAKDRIDKWEITNTQQIKNYQDQLDKLNGVDLEQQQTLHEELTLINSQLTKEVSLYEKIETKLNNYKKQIIKYQKELDHLKENKCPYCLQDFADTKLKINDLEDNIANTKTDLSSSKQELERIDKLIHELEIAHLDVKSQLTTPNIKDLVRIKSQSDTIEANLEILKTSINPHTESWKELTNITLEVVDYDDINNISKELEHQKLLLKLLTKKDSFVRKALLNKYIPYLNSRLQYYLAELSLRHKVEFTHEMTASISQFGRSLDFGNLSAGQRARVNLALSLAFSDVLQNLHAKINICMLDEVLDIGLDSVGVQAAAKLLKKKAKDENISMYIISHRDEVGGVFDHKMTVQMNRGFSYIVDNDVA